MARELTLGQVVGFLVDAPLFGDLDPSELATLVSSSGGPTLVSSSGGPTLVSSSGGPTLVDAMQVQVLDAGAWVFREGDPGEAWYVVYDGEVEVVKRSGGVERTIAVLGRRACFGEMAILDGSPRSASVRVVASRGGGVTVFRFPRSSFGRLLAAGNLAAYKLVYQIALVLVSRQRRTTSQLAEVLASAASEAPVHDALGPIVARSAVAE